MKQRLFRIMVELLTCVQLLFLLLLFLFSFGRLVKRFSPNNNNNKNSILKVITEVVCLECAVLVQLWSSENVLMTVYSARFILTDRLSSAQNKGEN